MKIGISTSVIQRGRSGIAQYVLNLVGTLREYAGRHDFYLFTLREDRELFEFAEDAFHLVELDESYRAPAADVFWHQTALPGLARRLDLDVLHIPSYRRMLWRRPCALVSTIHDLAQFHVAKKYDPLRMFYGRVIARALSKRQDEIISVSHFTARDLNSKFHFPIERIHVVHNGIDHSRFYPGDRSKAKLHVRKRFGLTRPYFLYVARLEHPGKNHLRLLRAFEEFKAATGSDWRLVLAGGDWHGAGEIHAAAERSPFREDIRRLGFVAAADLPDLIRGADAFVYPSLFEGFGLPPVEAMACGCPVLCSTRGSLGEVAGGAALTVEPESVEDIQRQLTRMSEQSELRDSLRRKGLRRAEEFRWDRAAAYTMEIYQKAAARRRPPLRTLEYSSGVLESERSR